MPKKNPKDGKPKMNEELKGFEIKINEFGEIKSNMDVNKLNDFLNRNVEDKKLKDREDLDDIIDKGQEIIKDQTDTEESTKDD